MQKEKIFYLISAKRVINDIDKINIVFAFSL